MGKPRNRRSGRSTAGMTQAKRRAIAYDGLAWQRSVDAPIGRCPGCGKLAFSSRRSAELGDVARAARLPGTGRLKVYRCTVDPRWWHHTTDGGRQDLVVFNQRGLMLRESDAEIAARFIGQVVAATGAGPTWGELFEAMGWEPAAGAVALRVLRKRGWVRFSTAPRSLRPGRRLDDEAV